MFRFFSKINSFSIFHKNAIKFTTIPILQNHLNLSKMSPLKVSEKFLSSKDQLSHKEFLTLVGYFSTSTIRTPTIWENVYEKLKHNLDQYGFSELALLSSYLGQAKQYDDKFWNIMEYKFLENLYVDEDTFYIIPLYLQGFADRGYKTSKKFQTRFLDYLESNMKDVKGNDAAFLAHMLVKLKSTFQESNPHYDLITKKTLIKCLEGIKFLDFKGLAHLSNALVLKKQMSDVLKNEIFKLFKLVENTVDIEGGTLVFQAFEVSDLSKNIGDILLSHTANLIQNAEGKLFAECVFTCVKNKVQNISLEKMIEQKIIEQIDLFDDSDSLKIGYCCSQIEFKNEQVIKILRDKAINYLDETTPEELVWVFEGYPKIIPKDVEFWKKVDEVFQRNYTEFSWEQKVLIDSIKQQISIQPQEGIKQKDEKIKEF